MEVIEEGRRQFSEKERPSHLREAGMNPFAAV